MKLVTFLFCLIAAPVFAMAACPNFSGTYSVAKDACYGDSYTLTYSQVGCDSLTENGLTVMADGKSTKTCYKDGSCMISTYRFSESEFESLHLYLDRANELDGYDHSFMSIDPNGNLHITSNWINNKDGSKKTCVNVAQKVN